MLQYFIENIVTALYSNLVFNLIKYNEISGFCLWTGINTVDFDEEFQHITAMKSLEGEVVSLKNKIHISNDVEVREKTIQIHFKCIFYFSF